MHSVLYPKGLSMCIRKVSSVAVSYLELYIYCGLQQTKGQLAELDLFNTAK